MLRVLIILPLFILSEGFSVETLTGVTLLWKTESNRSISTMEDRISEWLQHCYKMYCKKDGHYERWALYNWEVISL